MCERFLRSTQHSIPYFAQKAHLLGGECMVNFLICIGVWLFEPLESSFPVHFLKGWDHRTIITMLVWIPSGWCSTLVVKRCSALSKNIAQAAGALLTYLFSIQPVTLVAPALKPQPVVVPVFLLALVCMQSVVLFVVASEEEPRRKQKPTPSKLQLQSSDSAGQFADSSTLTASTANCLLGTTRGTRQNDPGSQADFAAVYLPDLRPSPMNAISTPVETPTIHNGLAMTRVSTIGADLYELAHQGASQESPKTNKLANHRRMASP